MPANEDNLIDGQAADEAPPFLRTWRRVYTGVLLYLALLILTLYLLTRIFAA